MSAYQQCIEELNRSRMQIQAKYGSNAHNIPANQERSNSKSASPLSTKGSTDYTSHYLTVVFNVDMIHGGVWKNDDLLNIGKS